MLRDERKIIANAIDANAFTSSSTGAGFVTPQNWERQILPMLRQELLVSAEAQVYDQLIGSAGTIINITVDDVPGPAQPVTENSDVPVTAVPNRANIQFDTTEYGARYQLTDTQAENSFVSEAQAMQTKLSYSLALAREDEAISLCESDADHKVYADGASSISGISSGAGLTYEMIVDAMTAIEAEEFDPYVLFTTPEQYASLLKDQQFSYVNHAGSNTELRRGSIPQVAGVDVFKSTRLTKDAGSGNEAHVGIMFGRGPLVRPIGFAPKRRPRVRLQREEPGRYTDFTATERWDMKTLRTGAIALLYSKE